MEKKENIKNKKHIVILTGAGISAESGLNTFRDTNGLWEGYNVYEVATPQGFATNPQLVLDFYNMRRKEIANAKPNAAHVGLTELEKDFNVTIITQNIDDLHERAGSSNIIHLHGEIFKMRNVQNNNKIYDIRNDINMGDTDENGIQLRPHIVWFEEPVPMIEEAANITSTADIFIVIGTSLLVYPAAGLIDYAPAFAQKIIIDKKIPSTNIKNIIKIEAPASEGVQQLKQYLY
ncbi:MAG: NAD-dependent deacylase [Bacteroidetes bacterium]|nr:NAD-dependent deacylase [Bacteroidota bacterium]MBS1650003.1 NAD-dependent deacylase [Bacteroidota bacterium]